MMKATPGEKQVMTGTTVVVIQLRQEWPPLKKSILTRNTFQNGVAVVEVDSEHNFYVTLAPSNKTNSLHRFQKTIIQPNSRFILTLRISDEQLSLRINEHELQLDSSGELEPLVITSNPIEPRPAHTLHYPDINPGLCSSEEEHLFLETVRDIDQRTLKGDRYSLISASGKLRLLLLDKLLAKANRAQKCLIEFKVIDHGEAPPIMPDSRWVSIAPMDFPGMNAITVNLDQFLKIPIYISGNSRATVKDVIRLCANSKGGVHHGPPKEAGEIILQDLDNSLQLTCNETSIVSLTGILRISLIAFTPLVRAIQEHKYQE